MGGPRVRRRRLPRLRLGAPLRRVGAGARAVLAAPLKPRRRTFLVLGLVGVPLIVFFVIARVATSALWFQELGHGDVFVRMSAAKLLLVLVVGAMTTLFLTGTAWLAVAQAPYRLSWRWFPATAAVCTLVGALLGWSWKGNWQSFLLWAHARKFGVDDPLHHRDIGYFVFSLPFLEKISDLLLLLVAIGLVLTIAVYVVTGALRWRPLRATQPARVHLALLGSLTLLLLAWHLHLETFSAELQDTHLRGKQAFPGPHYVDVHVRILGLRVLSYVALVSAFSVAAAPFLAFRGRVTAARRAAFLPAPALALVALVSQSWAPALVQRYVVEPNAISKEAPYLEDAIAGTRRAFGLNAAGTLPVVPKPKITPADVRRDEGQLDDVQLWDTSILRLRMHQLGSNTPYYRAAEPTLDAVSLKRGSRMTLIGERELDIRRAHGAEQGWSNNRLVYTHGYGAFRFSGTQISADQGPVSNARALPLRRPRIYFGRQQPRSPEWVAVDTRRAEFDRPTAANGVLPTYRYPGPARILPSRAFRHSALARRLRSLPPLFSLATGRAAEYRPRSPPLFSLKARRRESTLTAAEAGLQPYHYSGRGGIALSNVFRRAAFALRFHSLPLLFSNQITSRTRLIFHRDVRDRLQTLAPFVRWDSRPNALIVGGRIVFLVAGYTASKWYPYAHRIGIVGSAATYARASVQATVDAYSGRVHLYGADPTDPILRVWSAAFPKLFEPLSRMPPEFRARLRYPAALFDAQAGLYERFHVTNGQTFASDSDAWSLPTSLSGSIDVTGSIHFDESDEDDLRHRMRPSYRFATPAGGDQPHLLRSAYYSPRGTENLVATLDGWIDERGVPRLSSRSLPRDRVTLGPSQISRLVFLTPRVSNILGVRNRELSDLGKSSLDSVSLGSPHVVFFAGGILQIQTIYEGSSGRGIARMLGITVFLNGRAGVGRTLAAALREALHLPPAVKLGPLPGRVVVGRTVPIRFHVTNGLTEQIHIWSKEQNAQSQRFRLRDGPVLVQWTPRKPGHVRLRLFVRGLDGTLVARRTALTIRPAPKPRGGGRGHKPTVQFTALPKRIIVGRTVRLGFTVTNSKRETLRIEPENTNALTWKFRVPKGERAVEWTPRTAGRARLRILVRGADGSLVEAATNLAIGPRTARGP
jgi:uncharacterized membrane protein (UPF0182 family)